jgi:hypothetical protein
MATPEEQVERTEQAFKRLAEQGQEWPSMEQLAVEVMSADQNRRRSQRSRAANSIRDLMTLDRRRSKPAFRYRHQTQLGLIALEENHLVEKRFVDENGRPQDDPPTPRDYRDLRYRLIEPEPETAQDMAEEHHRLNGRN